MTKKFPILYKYTSTGKVQQWQIFVEGNTFYTEEGLKDGKITRSLPTTCTGKNIGKKNETSPDKQASTEAEAKFTKKKKGGYAENAPLETKSFFEPMLAKDYRNSKTKKLQVNWSTTTRKFVQPKLDGIRAINQNGMMKSRTGGDFITCPHLCQSDTILDGELYNHEFHDDFNAIVSMIKQSKPTEEDMEIARQFAQYWVYDFPSHDGVFSERYEALKEWFAKNALPGMVLVPTKEVFSEKDLEQAHAEFIGLGYEGTILRINDRKYENKRTTQLLKYKDFIDEEFEIVGYEEGKGGRVNTIGKFILQHDKDVDKTFSCNVKGKHKYLKEVWQNRDRYIGKTATVKYFNRTPLKENGDGDVPRFGFVIKIAREEYE